MLYYNNCESLSELFAKLEAITSTQILETANEIFDSDRMSILAYK